MTKTIFVLSKNGELIWEHYDTREDALKAIEQFDDEDTYLSRIYEMTEAEKFGRFALQDLFNTEDAQQLDDFIQESDDKEFYYLQLRESCCVDTHSEWIAEQYAQHFKFALLIGGYSGEESFEPVKLMTFKEYLSYLIKQINLVKARIEES